MGESLVPGSMNRYIAFLRAINVGGRLVKMADLRTQFESFGLTQVQSFIATGNVIFDTEARATPFFVRGLEDHLAARLGMDMKLFLRSPAELAAIVQHQAFEPAAQAAAYALNVAFLAEPMAATTVQRLMDLRSTIDDFHVHGREVYWLCRRRQNNSPFSSAVFERQLRLPTTFRPMKTLHRLATRVEWLDDDELPPSISALAA
jgi:uncharacterized protein (DUF1697 family)